MTIKSVFLVYLSVFLSSFAYAARGNAIKPDIKLPSPHQAKSVEEKNLSKIWTKLKKAIDGDDQLNATPMLISLKKAGVSINRVPDDPAYQGMNPIMYALFVAGNNRINENLVAQLMLTKAKLHGEADEHFELNPFLVNREGQNLLILAAKGKNGKIVNRILGGLSPDKKEELRQQTDIYGKSASDYFPELNALRPTESSKAAQPISKWNQCKSEPIYQSATYISCRITLDNNPMVLQHILNEERCRHWCKQPDQESIALHNLADELSGSQNPAKYEDFNSPIKQGNNEEFIDLCNKTIPDASHKIFFVLDGPEQRTTTAIRAKLGTEVPIYSPQSTPADYKKMDKSLATVLEGPASKYLGSADLTPKPNCLYLDYMGSAEGNEDTKVYPFTDLYFFLEDAYSSLEDIAIGITFSRRIHHPPIGFKSGDGIKAILNQITATTQHAGFEIIEIKTIPYKRTVKSSPMVTLLLKLKKSIPNNDQAFSLSNTVIVKPNLGMLKGKHQVLQRRYWGFDGSYADSWQTPEESE